MMSEARQINGRVNKLDSHQFAAFGQYQLVGTIVLIEWDVIRRQRGVGSCCFARVIGIDSKAKACAEGVR